VEEEGFQVDNADDDDGDAAEVRNIVFSNQRDNGDGTYLVNFLVKGKVEANYKLFVTLDREPIHGTPLEFAVKRAALAPEKCTVEGACRVSCFVSCHVCVCRESCGCRVTFC
jgi:hypothetical protein